MPGLLAALKSINLLDLNIIYAFLGMIRDAEEHIYVINE
jgi:hypothetical protein